MSKVTIPDLTDTVLPEHKQPRKMINLHQKVDQFTIVPLGYVPLHPGICELCQIDLIKMEGVEEDGKKREGNREKFERLYGTSDYFELPEAAKKDVAKLREQHNTQVHKEESRAVVNDGDQVVANIRGKLVTKREWEAEQERRYKEKLDAKLKQAEKLGFIQAPGAPQPQLSAETVDEFKAMLKELKERTNG